MKNGTTYAARDTPLYGYSQIYEYKSVSTFAPHIPHRKFGQYSLRTHYRAKFVWGTTTAARY